MNLLLYWILVFVAVLHCGLRVSIVEWVAYCQPHLAFWHARGEAL